MALLNGLAIGLAIAAGVGLAVQTWRLESEETRGRELETAYGHLATVTREQNDRIAYLDAAAAAAKAGRRADLAAAGPERDRRQARAAAIETGPEIRPGEAPESAAAAVAAIRATLIP